MKKDLWIIILILLALIVGGVYAMNRDNRKDVGKDGVDDDLIACTADAMQCPDGSWVGRTGPNCEFICPGE